MSGQRGPANGADVSGMEFEDSAWDSNDMMSPDGENTAADAMEDDDDDDGALDPAQDHDDEIPLEAEDDGDEEGEDELEAADDDETVDEDEQPEEDEGEEGDEEELEPIEPPARWPEAERQFFAALPPPLQHAYMARAQAMLSDYTKKTQALAGERQYYSQIGQVIQPHIQKWALGGMQPAQAIHQLIALSDFATSDPQGFIQYFANQRGVDLGQFAQQQQQNDEYLDPQVRTLREAQAAVQANLNQLAQRFEQGQQQQAQQQYVRDFRATVAGLDEFANQTGQDGKPLHPYLDDVANDMALLLDKARAQGRPISIDQAYRLACAADPRISSRIAARSHASQNAKRVKEAEKARRAAASITGSIPSNGSIPTGDMSVRDVIHAAYRGDIA